MKKALLSLLILLSISVIAQENKDIIIKTDIASATVFIKGAQVVRKTTASLPSLPAGKSTIKLTQLSPYIDPKSLQVKIDGEVMVLSVNYQVNYNDSIKQSDAIEKLTTQLNTLEEKLQVENATKEIISEELSFLRENKKIGGTDGVNLTNLKTTSTYYGERMSLLKMKDIEVDKRIKTLAEDKASLERKIAVAGNSKSEPAGEVSVNVDCKTAIRVPIELSYYVNNAGWYPSYDIRAKDISKPVELVYKANIMQNTKEDWKNIKLKVSSVNPNLGNVAPKLKTYLLNYYTKPPRYDGNDLSNEVKGHIVDTSGEPLIGVSVTVKGSTIGTSSDLDGNFTLPIPSGGGSLVFSYVGMITKTLPISNGFMNVVLEENVQRMDEVVVTGVGSQKKAYLTGAVTTVNADVLKKQKSDNIPLPVMQIENQTSIEFEIKTPYSILSGNKNTTVEMERYSLTAEYEYYAVPKVDKDAFLLANIVDWEQYNLLEGEANIFFENTFIGKTILDVRYMTDTLNISLGRDKGVSVQREKVKDFSSTKFLGSKTETTRDWKITIKNNKRQPISMVLFDQIPVSTLQEIEVNTENVSGGTVENGTGEVKWKFTLQPSQKKELNLKYKVKYPKDKNLTIE